MKKCITVAIVGLGNRGRNVYASVAKQIPDKMKVVAIADIDPEKVELTAKEYEIPTDKCFASAEELLEQEKNVPSADIKAIEAQIEEISEQITSNENSKVSINNKLTNAKNNLAEKENQLNKLKKQLEEFNFQDQVEADNISMNIQQTTAEIQAYKEQVSAYEDQIDSVKTTLNSLYNKKEKLAADKNFVVTASIGGTIVLSSNEKDYT